MPPQISGGHEERRQTECCRCPSGAPPGGNIKPDAARRKLQFRVNPSGGSNGRTRRSEGCFTFNSSRERVACGVGQTSHVGIQHAVRDRKNAVQRARRLLVANLGPQCLQNGQLAPLILCRQDQLAVFGASAMQRKMPTGETPGTIPSAARLAACHQRRSPAEKRRPRQGPFRRTKWFRRTPARTSILS